MQLEKRRYIAPLMWNCTYRNVFQLQVFPQQELQSNPWLLYICCFYFYLIIDNIFFHLLVTETCQHFGVFLPDASKSIKNQAICLTLGFAVNDYYRSYAHPFFPLQFVVSQFAWIPVICCYDCWMLSLALCVLMSSIVHFELLHLVKIISMTSLLVTAVPAVKGTLGFEFKIDFSLVCVLKPTIITEQNVLRHLPEQQQSMALLMKENAIFEA